MIYAKVIADSISPTGSRLTTIEAQFHRFILAEVNTHRAFSRNSASSRAIPTKKLIQQVRENPAVPVEFGSNKPGMQAGEEVDERINCEGAWISAAEWACLRAEELASHGVHKQVVNRLLEPFLWHRAIISSTWDGWANFFEQRISKLAQPEMQVLVESIRYAIGESEPEWLNYGEWHLPYVANSTGVDMDVKDTAEARKVSAARCARVSYNNFSGTRDVAKDLELCEKLMTADPPHFSPFEHVATPGDGSGNFDGWKQMRHMPEFW